MVGQPPLGAKTGEQAWRCRSALTITGLRVFPAREHLFDLVLYCPSGLTPLHPPHQQLVVMGMLVPDGGGDGQAQSVLIECAA